MFTNIIEKRLGGMTGWAPPSKLVTPNKILKKENVQNTASK